ncbi:lysylphosphatidylglycerol synthase domain-containing protein [Fibrella aquatilis]|uniref:Flippase-like domain-containing protein n=1 Tax=Fibrella aquatilis TaxID=2817059 RepID=A0A939G5M8_9BACT|nr:lysylphosphatidylglycerol synthase domain-containing protein [Fibrella aquatilis]MBO0930228.1 flippase-like domain-containing protein [Fibrella aquatilis]
MPGLAKKTTFWAKTGIFCLLLGFIGYTLYHQQTDWAALGRQLRHTNWTSPYALLLVLLVPLNWSLEALKWQWLTRHVTPLSFREALSGVLAGLSLGMALPGLGDTAGRVLSIRGTSAGAGSAATPNRAGAVGAALVSGGMQFYVAVVVGAVAWAVHLTQVPARNTPGGQVLLGLLVTLSAAGVALNFYRNHFVVWSVRWPKIGQYNAYWAIIGQYTHTDMAATFGLALLRNLTFSAQLYAAFRLYGIGLPSLELAAGVGVVFLVKTITPAVNWLSDLGVREAAALWVFAPSALPAPLLLAATLTLWLVNILLPVGVGLLALGSSSRQWE